MGGDGEGPDARGREFAVLRRDEEDVRVGLMVIGPLAIAIQLGVLIRGNGIDPFPTFHGPFRDTITADHGIVGEDGRSSAHQPAQKYDRD